MSTLLTKLAADFTTQLATSISVGGTTATLISQTDDDGNTLPDGVYVFTLDGATSNKEYIRCTKTGTSLTSIQSLSRQGALTSGCVRAHRIGTSVSITDWAQLKYLTDLLSGATDLDSTDPLKYDGTATISNDAHLATKKYVDDTAIAGSPKATDSVYGITKLSVAAVSATDPIAVGDNDTRVPTQGENDALAGTSGTPSSSNKYVTNDDTSTLITADKLLRINSAGNINAFTLAAGQDITAGDVLFSGSYNAVNAVYDNKAYNNGLWSGASTAITQSYTVGSGSSRVLIVSVVTGFSAGGPGTIASISYGGVAMTLLSSATNSSSSYVYYLLNPASGANNITFTIVGAGGYSGVYGIVTYSYSSVGSVALGAVADTNGTTITSANSAYDTLLGLGFHHTNGGGTGTTISSTILSSNSQSSNTSTISYYSGTTNSATEAGSGVYTFTFTGGSLSQFQARYIVRLVPSTAPTTGFAKKASASTTFPYYSTIYQNVIGIAGNTVTAGGDVNIVGFGLFKGLTSLTTGSTYYLSNTPGAIGTSAGATSKVVGTALSTTSLFLQI